MTQEEKQLLLKDLCARLPYGVIALAKTDKGEKTGKIITVTSKFKEKDNLPIILGELCSEDECFWLDYGLFKPYLRPMSSMTEEEETEFRLQCANILSDTLKENSAGLTVGNCKLVVYENDWLNAHHFDYRGLIEKGLALEAPKDMYKTE